MYWHARLHGRHTRAVKKEKQRFSRRSPGWKLHTVTLVPISSRPCPHRTSCGKLRKPDIQQYMASIDLIQLNHGDHGYIHRVWWGHWSHRIVNSQLTNPKHTEKSTSHRHNTAEEITGLLTRHCNYRPLLPARNGSPCFPPNVKRVCSQNGKIDV